MRSPAWPVATALLALTVLACDGDSDSNVTPTIPPSPGSTAPPAPPSEPTAASSPSPTRQPAQPLHEITGLFLDPRPADPDAFVNVLPRPESPFEPWDRESIVVYDLETMTETNYGQGLAVTMSPDETRLAYNTGQQQGGNKVRVVNLQDGNLLHEFEWNPGLAGFAHDDYMWLAGSMNRERVYDLRNNKAVFVDELTDTALRARFSARTGPGQLLEDRNYRLTRIAYEDDGGQRECNDKAGEEAELCRAEAFEQWTLEDASNADVLLAFRAYDAAPAGPGELVIATSPQCEAADGSSRWCPEVLVNLRSDDPEDEYPYEEAHGTTNVFIVDIETGVATFVATASFTPDTRVTPENWPLIANEDYVVWTESYCSLDSPGSTRVLDRKTGEITELDASLWVAFTPTGDLGVDPFGPRAILDIETFEWNAVLPGGVIDVGESSSGRYLYVGGVLGHGGLCG